MSAILLLVLLSIAVVQPQTDVGFVRLAHMTGIGGELSLWQPDTFRGLGRGKQSEPAPLLVTMDVTDFTALPAGTYEAVAASGSELVGGPTEITIAPGEYVTVIAHGFGYDADSTFIGSFREVLAGIEPGGALVTIFNGIDSGAPMTLVAAGDRSPLAYAGEAAGGGDTTPEATPDADGRPDATITSITVPPRALRNTPIVIIDESADEDIFTLNAFAPDTAYLIVLFIPATIDRPTARIFPVVLASLAGA